jgi:hypothetical protein
MFVTVASKLTLLTLLALCWKPLIGQDFPSHIKELQSKYSSPMLQIVIAVGVHESKESKAVFKTTVDVRKSNESFWYRMDNTEMLMTENAILSIDRRGQTITRRPRSIPDERKFFSSIQFNPDSLSRLQNEVVHISSEEGIDHFMMEQSQGDIREVHLFFDQSSNPVRLEYVYQDGQFATIEFVVFDVHPKFDQLFFEESRYIRFESDKALPTANYKSFKVNYKN